MIRRHLTFGATRGLVLETRLTHDYQAYLVIVIDRATRYRAMRYFSSPL